MDGQNQYQQSYWQQPERQPKDSIGFGVASLVLGIISLLLFCSCINWLTGVLAIIFGIIQIVNSRRRKMAIAGIITAALSLVLTVSLYGSFFFGGRSVDDGFDDYFDYYYNFYDDYDNHNDFYDDFEDYMEDAGDRFL